MQDQVFQSAVQVVGLCETVSAGCAVDDAVLHLAFHTTDRNMRDLIIKVILNQNLTSDKDKKQSVCSMTSHVNKALNVTDSVLQNNQMGSIHGCVVGKSTASINIKKD